MADGNKLDIPCRICNRFQGNRPIESRNRSSQPRRGTRNHRAALTWNELEQSASSCYCCNILLRGSRGCFELHGIKEDQVHQINLLFDYPFALDVVESESSLKSLEFLLNSGRNFQVEIFATYDEAYPIPDSWDYFYTSPRVVSRSNSSEALAIIRNWLGECVDEHSSGSLCETPPSSGLPTRVVDVGDDNQSVKLINSNGEKGGYICLSHCWGLAQIVTTTKATIDARKLGIPWDLLSKTFQDAISMTRMLGFRYIWIDSLCIVQDDASDWERESAQMASVYSNGYLTLAGTRSANGNGGLFSERDDVEVSGMTPLDEAYYVYFRQRIDHHIEMIDDSVIEHYPLLTRAWVYQERMLSTRVVHFGHFELFFECRSGIECECGFISCEEGSPEIEKPLVKIEFAQALSELKLWGMDIDTAYYAARVWRTVVASYTVLSLTKSTDRLPALGGLASHMAAVRQASYLAGLWKDSLNDDLLWGAYYEAETTTRKPRPSPRIAPTWSWASTAHYVDYNDTILFSSFEIGTEREQEPHQHFATIEHCTTLPSAVNEFGAIQEGSLKITGLFVTGSIQYGTIERAVGRLTPGPLQTYKSYLFCLPSGDWPVRPDYLFDTEGSESILPATEVYCLRMSHLRVGSWQKLVSLVLRVSPDRPDCFERIGLLEVKSRTEEVDCIGVLYEAAGLRTITIV
ncbi:hypothetical protein OPT61_g3678 [Boeremia exigua]|uniref:Uncharacterized protein n=1 Tax=Boeremia exigua TaxID=749465 RepID=A0ACC2IH41_9PLEO|nr:hypothetical protein OPT61_g3678 [Boeremia exigua]